MLLVSALKSRIPLIAARTEDVGYFKQIMECYVPEPVKRVVWKSLVGKEAKIESFLNSDQIGYLDIGEHKIDWEATYQWLQNQNSVLVVLNPHTVHYRMMEVGEVQVPPELVAHFVEECGVEKHHVKLVAALSGLSYTNIQRIAQLATSEYGEFTPKSVRAIRREFFQVLRGLEEVGTDIEFYFPPKKLQEWLKVEGKLFLKTDHPMLMSKGFLFKGVPGTGKTLACKYLARELDLPLYRLDMGMILSKYVGEADERLISALQQVESFAPCVLLLDEVEKLFDVVDSAGVIQRLLGYLLWWLQERVTKVLVIMTTNNVAALPKELYRAGRIDEEVDFIGLDSTEVLSFVNGLLDYVQKTFIQFTAAECFLLKQEFNHAEGLTQAQVTERVLRQVKLKLVQQWEK